MLLTYWATSFVSDLFLFGFLPPPLKHTKVILKDVDSLLYVDTDVLFLRPVDDIWKLLRQFNATQLAAMAPEHEIPKIGWYSRFARHPFYGSAGVNSGVMLMNLTRIRSAQFKVSKYFLVHGLKSGFLVISTVMFLDCQCIDFGSRWLVGKDGRGQGRGKYLERYEIFVQEKSR